MKRKLVWMLTLVMAAGLTACGPKTGTEAVDIEGQKIGAETAGSEGIEEAATAGTEAGTAEGGEEQTGSQAQTAAAEETYVLQDYDSDLIYQVDGAGNKLAVYNKEQARSALERGGLRGEDVILQTLVDSVAYYYTCDYIYETEDSPVNHEYNFYAYDFDADRLKNICTVSTRDNLVTYDLYRGRLYLYFEGTEGYTEKVFDIDRANLEFTEVSADNETLLQAIAGWTIRGQEEFMDYRCTERMLDNAGFILISRTDWESEDPQTEYRKVYRDGTVEEMDSLEGGDYSLSYWNEDWIVLQSYAEHTFRAVNARTGEQKEFAGARMDLYASSLALSGDLFYYYYTEESEAEYKVASYQIYTYDWSAGKNELVLETATAPGNGGLRPGVEGFRVIEGVPYGKTVVGNELVWARIENGRTLAIDCPLKEFGAFRYGGVIYNSVKKICSFCGEPYYEEYREAFALNEEYSPQATKINEQLSAGLDSLGENIDTPSDSSECEYHGETDESYVQDVVILKDRLLGVYSTGYWYGGGAHGYPSRGQRLFDLTTGEELHTVDLYTGTEEDFKTCVAEQTKKYFGENPNVFYSSTAEDVYNDAYESADPTLDNIIWGETSATYLFTPYEIGPYASGYIEIELPYEEFLGMDLISALNANHPLKSE